MNNDPEALLRELESGASPYLGAGSYDTRSPLCLVLEHARDPATTAACVRVLLNRAGTSIVNSIDDDHVAPLHHAAEHVFTEVVAVFLEAGVEVDSTWRGRTALHFAAGRTMQYGARGLVKDSISSALAKRHEATTRVLLEAGASVNAPTDFQGSLTPLHFAAASGMYEVCNLLLAAGASVDLVGRHGGFGDTPLAYAYRWTSWHEVGPLPGFRRVMRIVPLLLRAGAALPVMPVRLPEPELTPGAIASHLYLPYDCPYIRKVRAAGGFQAYEKQHLAALVALLAPKLAHLVPTDVLPRIVSFWYPVGFW